MQARGLHSFRQKIGLEGDVDSAKDGWYGYAGLADTARAPLPLAEALLHAAHVRQAEAPGVPEVLLLSPDCVLGKPSSFASS